MTIKLVTAAALFATASTAAFAAGAGVEASDVNGNPPRDETRYEATADADMNTGGTVAVESQAPAAYGDLLASIQSGSTRSTELPNQIAALTDDATVNVVSMAEIKNHSAETSAAMQEEATAQRIDVDNARDAIRENAMVSQKLQSMDYSADDVVLVGVNGTNELTLVVKG